MIALPQLDLENRRVQDARDPAHGLASRAPARNLDDFQRDKARPLIDACNRRIDHLRLSVTSSCDLRCAYCRPAHERHRESPHADWSDTQRFDLVQFLHDRFMLRQLRLTGGEPLLHRTLAKFIRGVRQAMPHLEIAMTTNGRHLVQFAHELRSAGLERLNVSLDTLDGERYRRLTGGELRPVLDGLDAAAEAGFPPPRINAVVLRGINDHDLAEMAQWAMQRSCEIRFLEAMPIGPAAAFNREHFVPAYCIRETLKSAFELNPLPGSPGQTATRYEAVGAHGRGVVGIIAPVSESFCGQCRRIRVTANGRLFPCLLDSRSVDLSPAWRGNAFNPDEAESLIHSAVGGKKPSGPMRQSAAMITLGG